MNPLVKWLGGALVVVVLGAGVWIQTARLDAKNEQLKVEQGNTRVAQGAAEAARLALASQIIFNRQVEDERLIAEADLATLRKEYDHVREDLLASKSAGKGAPLSPAGRAYFERLRRP